MAKKTSKKLSKAKAIDRRTSPRLTANHNELRLRF